MAKKEEILIQLNLKYNDAQAEKNLTKVEKLMRKIAESTDDAAEAARLFDEELAKMEAKDAERAKLKAERAKQRKLEKELEIQEQQKLNAAQEKQDARLKSLEGTSKMLAGSISLAGGAMGMLGIEGEKAQETLLKVQSAASMATGVKDLSEGYTQLSSSMKTAGISFGSLTKTMMANPIMLIATAIVGLLAATGKLDDVFKALTQTLGKVLKPVFDAFEKVFRALAPALEPLLDIFVQLLPILMTLNVTLMPVLLTFQMIGAFIKPFIPLIEKMGKFLEYVADSLEYFISIGFGKFGEVLQNITDGVAGFITNLFGLEETTNENKITQSQYNKIIDAGTKLLEQRNEQLEKFNWASEIQERLAAARGASDAELYQLELKRLNVNYERAKSELQVADSVYARLKADNKLKLVTKEQMDEYENLKKKVAETGVAIVEATAKRNDEVSQKNKEAEEKRKANEEKTEQDRLNLLNEKLAEEIKLYEESFITRGNLERQKFLDGTITQKELNDELKKLDDERLFGMEEFYIKQKDIITAFEGVNAEEKKKLITKSEQDITKAQKDEIDLRVKNKIASDKELTDTEKQALKDKLENIDKDYADQIDDLQDKRYERETQRIIESLNLEKEAMQEKLNLYKVGSEEYIALQEEIFQKEKEINRAKREDDEALKEQEKSDRDAAKDAAMESFNQAKGLSEAISQVKLNILDREINAAKKAGKDTEALEKQKYKVEKNAFKRSQGFRVGETIMATAQAAISAYTAMAKIDPIILAPIAAGIASAFGLAQVAAITTQQFPPFEGGGGGTPPNITPPSTPSLPSESSQAPTFGGGQFFGLGQAQITPSFGKESMKVYVTETDIRNTSNKVKVIEDRASIG